MKFLRVLLVSALCLTMALSCCVQVCVAAFLDPAVLRQYFVCVTNDTNINDFALPEWAQPEWTPVGSTEKGVIYFLFCVINSSASDKFAQILTETLTEEQGVIEYLAYAEHKEMGDINADGTANAKDALLCLQMAVGKYNPKTVDEFMRSLVCKKNSWDIPNKPDATCALYILQMAVGKY